MKTLTIDGHAVALDDAAFIAVSTLQKQLGTTVADALAKDTALNDAKAEHAKAIEAKDGEVLKLQADHKVELTAKDARIAELEKSALTADKLDAAVAERSAVLEAAKPILGDGYDAKGKTVADVRRAAVAKLLGDKAVEGKTDEHVVIAFDTLKAIPAVDPLRQVIVDRSTPPNGNVVQIGDAATEYARMRERDANAWKKEA